MQGTVLVVWHDLRHEYGSFLVEQGATIQEVKEMMRHAVERLCCASGLTGTFTLTGGDFDAFLVGFEEFRGRRPEANDVQPFQVSVEAVR